MALSLATVGAKISATFVNLIIAVVNKQGETSVIPTSVAGTGVALGTNGVVTLTAATGAFSLNGIFTSAFTNYRIECDFTSSSSVTVTAVFRLAGADITTANYDIQTLQGVSAAAASALTAATASWGLTAVTGTFHDIQLILKRPALNLVTYGRASVFSGQTAALSAPALRLAGIFHRLATAYDGITFTPSAGGSTGTVRVYGWNDN